MLAFTPARRLKKASAIWLRPELPTQTERIGFICFIALFLLHKDIDHHPDGKGNENYCQDDT